MEWNDLPFRETVFENTYQTMPETAWNYWNLIKFNEHPREDGAMQWLMRKDQCMHCEDPGCLRACPADGAIVQYTTASSISSRRTASGANTALPVVHSTSRSSTA